MAEVHESPLGPSRGRHLQDPSAAYVVVPQHHLCTACQHYGHLFLWMLQCRHRGAITLLCDFCLLNGSRLIRLTETSKYANKFLLLIANPLYKQASSFLSDSTTSLQGLGNKPLISSLCMLRFPSPFIPSRLQSPKSYSSHPLRSSSNSSSFMKWFLLLMASLVTQLVKNLPAMQETWV